MGFTRTGDKFGKPTDSRGCYCIWPDVRDVLSENSLSHIYTHARTKVTLRNIMHTDFLMRLTATEHFKHYSRLSCLVTGNRDWGCGPNWSSHTDQYWWFFHLVLTGQYLVAEFELQAVGCRESTQVLQTDLPLFVKVTHKIHLLHAQDPPER